MKCAVIVLLCLLALTGCSNSFEEQISTTQKDILEGFSPEYERFVSYEANYLCDLMASGSSEDQATIAMTKQTTALAYGFTDSDIVRMQVKYKDDADFKNHVYDRMVELCPEFAEASLE